MRWQYENNIKKLRKHWNSFPEFKIHTIILTVGCLLLIVTSPLRRSSGESDTSELIRKTTVQKDPATLMPWDFFHPTWEKAPLLGFFKTENVVVETLLESPVNTSAFVQDPDARIDKEFQVSDNMRSSVSFWVDVYARYSSNIRIVHDREDLSIIYGYLDFRPFYRTMNRMAADIKSYQVEKQVLKQLKVKISEASELIKTTTTSREEKEFIRSFLSSKGLANKESVSLKLGLIRTQSGQSDMFLQALNRSKILLPHIEAVFRQNGLPVALARIPFVESSFNAKALSKIGAVGIWQFTRETAREMIHAENELYWADPLRQTKSAARLLRMYKNILPDWGTVVTSYNSGVGRLRRIVEKNGFSKMEQIYALPHDKDGLGFAGRNFYPEFLAANIVEAYKEEIFSHLLTPTDYLLVFKGNGIFATDACEM